MTKKQLAAQEEAKASLRELLRPGDTVNTILRHVSRSGMMRHISLVIKSGDDIRDITWLAAHAMDMRLNGKGQWAIKIGGCGMDMGFAIVYDLGRTLFRDGFKVEGRGRNGDESGWDNDGGYALKQGWL